MKVIQKFKSRSIARLSEANGVRFGQRGRRFCNSLPRLGWSFLGQRSNKRRIHHIGCTKSPLELSLSERKQATWQGKAKADETPPGKLGRFENPKRRDEANPVSPQG